MTAYSNVRAMCDDQGLLKPYQHGNHNRIAVLFFLCYDERTDKVEGLPWMSGDNWGNQADQTQFALNF